MNTPPLARTESYWAISRSHRYSLLLALPLLATYELLEVVAPIQASGGTIRNGADVILTGLFTWIFGPRGPLVFMAVVIGLSLWLIYRDRASGPLRWRVFAAMAAEALVYSLLFGVVVGVATMKLLGPMHPLAAPVDHGLAGLTLSLGAGLYEELLFRVVLVAALAALFRFLGMGRLIGGGLATCIGAVIFSAFHYIGPLGEPFQVESFAYRAVAGLAFSALYLTRGFGITAWTHALYDIAILV